MNYLIYSDYRERGADEREGEEEGGREKKEDIHQFLGHNVVKLNGFLRELLLAFRTYLQCGVLSKFNKCALFVYYLLKKCFLFIFCYLNK